MYSFLVGQRQKADKISERVEDSDAAIGVVQENSVLMLANTGWAKILVGQQQTKVEALADCLAVAVNFAEQKQLCIIEPNLVVATQANGLEKVAAFELANGEALLFAKGAVEQDDFAVLFKKDENLERVIDINFCDCAEVVLAVGRQKLPFLVIFFYAIIGDEI